VLMRCVSRVRALTVLAGLCVLPACTTAPAFDERPLYLGQVTPTQDIVGKRVTSFQERKFQEIVKQRTDFSCGAAAVATIFNYAYGRTTNETQILVNMLRVSDARVVRARGFSLLDIKRYVEAVGWRGEGYQVPFETLYELKVPAIVLLNTRGYKHFVVLRKARDGYVQLADPALGNRIMWREDFEAAWNGIVFAILGDGYNEKNILSNPPEPLSARRLYALNSPVFDVELYDFGLGPSTSFSF
jgi:predicted double-glycine peptidase